jgi:hypothetical protein
LAATSHSLKYGGIHQIWEGFIPNIEKEPFINIIQSGNDGVVTEKQILLLFLM